MISIGRPTAYPESAPPGPVLLTIPITSTEGLWATVRVLVYEGSFLPGHGTLLWYQDQTLFLTGTISIQFMRSASVLGTIDRRDVRVRVFDQNAQLVADEEWDDIYYVRETEEPELKVLRFEILGEEQGGSINFNPPPLDAEGHYEKGTVVSLTAIVNAGFVFVRWHGDVNEPVTSLTNSITMDENHTIRAEFAFAEVEALWPLEVDITPAEGGYVTTSPPPVDITNHFTNGTVGKFIEDTRVQVTAHANLGYEFEKWSDEIQGGVSYNRTEWVSGVMDERKAVKAHFRSIEIPPECSIDADCPAGYVCQDGICIPEEEPPDGEEPEKKFPWLAAGLIGGGVAFLIASTKPKRK